METYGTPSLKLNVVNPSRIDIGSPPLFFIIISYVSGFVKEILDCFDQKTIFSTLHSFLRAPLCQIYNLDSSGLAARPIPCLVSDQKDHFTRLTLGLPYDHFAIVQIVPFVSSVAFVLIALLRCLLIRHSLRLMLDACCVHEIAV
jgi:hypothetical protein